MTNKDSLFDSGTARQGNPAPFPWAPAATTGYPPPGPAYPPADPPADPAYAARGYPAGPAVATGYAPGPAADAAAMPARPPLVTALAIAVPIVATLSLLIPEGGGAAITNVVGWSLVALTSAVLVTVGTLLSSPAARQLRILGAGGLTLFWVLISLPVIERNTALGVTLAVVASLWLVWSQERTR
jgi:hypothetical protein